MKINEVFEKLIENPKDVYQCFLGNRFELSLSSLGYFRLNVFDGDGKAIDRTTGVGGFSGNLKPNLDWQLVRQSVDFMTAMNSDQKVKPKNLYQEIGFAKPDTWLRNISLTLEAVNGKWEIE